MKPNELRALTKEELLEKNAALKKELFELRCKAKLGQADKPHNFRRIRKDIARVYTILFEKKVKGERLKVKG